MKTNIENFGCIYCYTNMINNKKYIGFSKHFNIRDLQHRHLSKIDTKGYFHRAINKLVKNLDL